MRFGVLGPLAVWTTEGRPVKVPEAKVRALLADLLIHEGRLVSADRLVEDLWDDALPANPVGALQTKVSQLRRVLEEAEPGGRELLAHQPPGYRLQVDAEGLDAQRFAALTRRAREAEDPRTKASLLADALDLWRGPALADVADEEFARAAIARLEEQRLVALEEQAETQLGLGEHSLLVGELGDLVARYPFRERLRAAHMRALYRSGRQNEALNSYNDLRNRLLEELGLDPSPELASLHLAILEQDPVLEPGPEPPNVPASTGSRTNLPAPLTGLIGRTEAVAEVRSLLDASRLVTLTGPGGVGKTRLAVEAARQEVEAFPDGVWLVELTALDQPSGPDVAVSVTEVAEMVTAVLGLRDDAAARALPAARPTDPTDRLTGALHDRQVLLLLDNCEHLVEPVAKLAEHLLAGAPRLRIVATSQEPLGISGEVLHTVPPLDLPDAGTETELAAVGQSSAVQLFAARAAAAAPGFTLDTGNASAVAAICRRLDGIPLALELAAARVRVLGVQELAKRLDDRFRLLAAGRRDAPARQRTLRAMIDWSWELLTASERTVLRRLAVHTDSCSLEAAEEICSGVDIAPDEVLDLLARLVDRSLVVVTGNPDHPRYGLLESVAAYCAERLLEAGELACVQARHDRCYAALAERVEPRLRGSTQKQWLERLDAETANLRNALDGAVRDGDSSVALRLVNAMAWYWFLRGRLGEARRSLAAALSIDGDAPGSLRASATLWQAGMAMWTGDATPTVEQSTAALRLQDDPDDPGTRARAEWFLGFAELGFGDLSASEDRVGRALTSFRTVDDPWGTAAALSTVALQALLRGDLAAVERNGQQSLHSFQEIGDRWGQLQAMDSLASLAEISGDYGQTVRLHREGLRIAEDLGLWTEVSYRLSGLGRAALLTDDYPAAERYHERARQLAIAQSDRRGEEFAEIGLGLAARRQGMLHTAEAHLSKWLDWNRQLGARYGEALILTELGFIAEQRGDTAAAMALQQEGFVAASATGDPRAVAFALEGLAGAHALAGQHEDAARLLGRAAATRQSVGAPLPPAERGDVDRITAAVQAALGRDTLTAELDRGAAAVAGIPLPDGPAR